MFSDAALKLLMEYPYPGNIRELRNIVEYCVNICQGRQIEIEHLPKYLLARLEAVAEAIPEPMLSTAVAAPAAKPVRPQPASGADRDWQAIEKELIVNTLTQTRGNRSKAAALLGWGRTTLWRKLKSHGLVTDQGNTGATT